MIESIRHLFRLESTSGILLIVVAGLAMICANTDLKSFYDGLRQIPVGIQFGTFQIHKPLLLWINDGLLRQYLPKGTDLSAYTQRELNAIAQRLNTRPRKCLSFATPLEVYAHLRHSSPVALGT